MHAHLVASQLPPGQLNPPHTPSQVDKLLLLLANILLIRPAADGRERVYPYHKSVLDWLTCTEGMDSGQFRVSVATGHHLLGAACHAACMAAKKSSGTWWPEVLLPATPSQQQQQQQRQQKEPPLLQYSLRHAVAHLSLAAMGDSGVAKGGAGSQTQTADEAMAGLLQEVVLWPGFWRAAFTAGRWVREAEAARVLGACVWLCVYV